MDLFALPNAVFNAVCNGIMIAVGIGMVGAAVLATRAALIKETPKPEKDPGVFVEGHFV